MELHGWNGHVWGSNVLHWRSLHVRLIICKFFCTKPSTFIHVLKDMTSTELQIYRSLAYIT